MKKTITLFLLYLVIVPLLPSCKDMFDYSIYTVNFEGRDKNVNQKNIRKINAMQAPDTFHVAFISDTHDHWDDFESWKNKVNEINKTNKIDFAIHAGDFADFGHPQQYQWANEKLFKLDFPYVVTLGNHDLVSAGENAYKEMFGKFDFSFVYGTTKFVFLNTNSLEFGNKGNVPDNEWLNKEINKDDCEQIVLVFHVPPEDSDFDFDLKEAFYNTISANEKILFCIHGHQHHHEIYTPDKLDIPFINVYGVQHKKANLITISNGYYHVETIEF